MNAEYSVEEVRARLAKLHDFINGKCANDEAGWKCVGFIFQHGEQLLNILAERIKADESAVPSHYGYRYPDGFIRHDGGGKCINGAYPIETIPYFTRPPAPVALVPVNPTPAMDSAGQDAVDAWLTAAVDTGEAADGKSPAAWTYKAMLAAAPPPGESE